MSCSVCLPFVSSYCCFCTKPRGRLTSEESQSLPLGPAAVSGTELPVGQWRPGFAGADGRAQAWALGDPALAPRSTDIHHLGRPFWALGQLRSSTAFENIPESTSRLASGGSQSALGRQIWIYYRCASLKIPQVCSW